MAGNKNKKNRHTSAEAPTKPYVQIIIFALVLVALMSVLIKSLYDLTIVQGESYLERADREATNTIVTKGRRGTIYDRNGLVLAYVTITVLR